MDPIGMLGEITIRTAYVIFSGSVLIQTYIDCGSWLRTIYIKEQLPQAWEVRYMAFCLLVAVVCLIGISYLYWMVLGAWRASRRSINQPWSALHIIQPNHPVSSATSLETSLPVPILSSEQGGGLGLASHEIQSQGLEPPEMVNAWPQGLTDPQIEIDYEQEIKPSRPNSYNRYRQPHDFRAPKMQRGMPAPLGDAPRFSGTRIPRPKPRLTRFQDIQDTPGVHRFATSLPQHFGDGFSGPSLWRSHFEERDADGDVNMLGRRRRFH